MVSVNAELTALRSEPHPCPACGGWGVSGEVERETTVSPSLLADVMWQATPTEDDGQFPTQQKPNQLNQ